LQKIMGKIQSLRSASPSDPVRRFEAVTPSDDADLPGGLTRGVFIGVSGAFVVTDRTGNSVTFVSGAGQSHPIQVMRIRQTGTTAGGIVALY
jgi:hypothetical protein